VSNAPDHALQDDPFDVSGFDPALLAELMSREVSPERSRTLPAIDASNLDLPLISAEAWDALLAANGPPRLCLRGRRPTRLDRSADSPAKRAGGMLMSVPADRVPPSQAGARWLRSPAARQALWPMHPVGICTAPACCACPECCRSLAEGYHAH
jgi:hypothetical protein